ncbi:MAG: hypothetical protein KatS3mg015_2425 [Fimbriimonadales bacterium]|nr:MAG: hypothetical protein KatS3mg015_2425 [Fimbriimonadales bacterium]
MDIVARARKVKEQARRYEDLRRLADQQREFKGWLEKFQERAVRLEAISRIREHLSGAGVRLQAVMPADELRKDLQAFLEEFQRDRSVLTRPERAQANKGLLERLKALADDHEAKTREDWREFVMSIKPAIPDEVLQVLGRIPAFRESVRFIRSTLDSIDRASLRLPQSQEEITRVRDEAEAVRRRWDELGGEGIPEEVLTFLRAAGAAGAPLQTLTDAVRTWLQANGLEGSFVITMRAIS